MPRPFFLLLDQHGHPTHLLESFDEALDTARGIAPDDDIWLDAPTDKPQIEEMEDGEWPLAANPRKRALRVVTSSDPLADRAPYDAMKALLAAMKRTDDGPAVDYDEAASMSLEEAHSRLVGMFPRYKFTKTGVRKGVRAYETPEGMARSFLGQNKKTAMNAPCHTIARMMRQTGKCAAHSTGLNMLPHTQAYANKSVRQIMRDGKNDYGIAKVRVPRLNACVRATPECSSSCLAFSGMNLNDNYNTVKKYALTSALVHEPVAFVRMLSEAIRHHVTVFDKAWPLVRLNVYSDIPWELAVPGLFAAHPDVQFYDYTKLPGRTTPSNYDLTFSFSGSPGNVEAMDAEIRRGRRVAVVFAGTGISKTSLYGEIVAPKKPGALPKRFLGLPVVDGDESDLRPLDPAPVIVGLTWKRPQNQGVTVEKAKVFIVLVDVVENEDGTLDAIVSKTPRFDNIDYAKYAPSVVDR